MAMPLPMHTPARVLKLTQTARRAALRRRAVAELPPFVRKVMLLQERKPYAAEVIEGLIDDLLKDVKA